MTIQPDDVTFIDADTRTSRPHVGERALVDRSDHVHVRHPERCIKRRNGLPCSQHPVTGELEAWETVTDPEAIRNLLEDSEA